MTAGVRSRGDRRIDGRRSGVLAGRIVVIMAALLITVPLLYAVSIAFKPEGEVFADTPTLIPDNATLDNFSTALSSVDLGRAMVNSCIVAAIVVAANLLFATMAGYAFARLQFRGSGALFYLLLATAMVPGAVTLVPLYLITRGIPLAGGNDLFGYGGTGLLDSLPGLALPGLIGAMNVFLARQYFLAASNELAEAARIDGAGEWRIFFQVYAPLARPLFAVIAIFSFTGVWDDFLWPLVITSSQENVTVQLALSRFLVSGNIQYGPAMAGTVLVILPVLAVFIFNQRSFISGLADGSVKG